MSNTDEGQWLSSVEVMNITGISRATLNNYIKMGLIPKPVVQRPDDPLSRARKIGFFPKQVIEQLDSVKQMKTEGRSMEHIITQLKGDGPYESSVDSQFADRDRPQSGGAADARGHGEQGTLFKDETQRDISISSDQIQLTIAEIGCPAYLVNNNFEIDWINAEAEEVIFRREIRLIREAALRNIFKLFFDTRWQRDEDTRQSLIEFHMQFVRSKHQRSALTKIFDGISEREIRLLEKAYEKIGDSPKGPVSDQYFHLPGIGDGTTSYHVYHIIFREGILFVYAPTDGVLQGIVELLSSRGRLVKEVLKQRMPTLTTFCVLVADLQSSSRICAELPPEEYFELINQIWKRMEGTFKRYYGTYGKHVGDGMVYYFLKDNNSDYIMNAISCALELREKMKVLSMEWRLRKGWTHDLFINIGINEGQEYFWTIPASPNIEFTALGDSVNYAGRLSDFSRYGAIWTTKNLINKLNLEDRRKIRFGIVRQDQERDVFVENIFARVMDLMLPDNPHHRKFMDIATLPITQISEQIAP